jgi:carbon monoxide dehydrogenase subunit G
MKLQHRLAVPAARTRVWTQFDDIPGVAACVPGAEGVVAVGESRYRGRMVVAIGPVRLAFEGEVTVESRDDATGRLVLRAAGTDRRLGGSVRAVIELALTAVGDEGTEILIDSDVVVLGRLGELGQPIMRRKADEVMRAFAANLAERLA